MAVCFGVATVEEQVEDVGVEGVEQATGKGLRGRLIVLPLAEGTGELGMTTGEEGRAREEETETDGTAAGVDR